MSATRRKFSRASWRSSSRVERPRAWGEGCSNKKNDLRGAGPPHKWFTERLAVAAPHGVTLRSRAEVASGPPSGPTLGPQLPQTGSWCPVCASPFGPKAEGKAVEDGRLGLRSATTTHGRSSPEAGKDAVSSGRRWGPGVAHSAAPYPPGREEHDFSMDDTVTATVEAELPQRLYRLKTDDGAIITAGPSNAAQRLGLPIAVGGRVLVRRAKLDPARGVIVGPAPL